MDLFNKYGGQQKSLKCCDKGGHNSKRNTIIINEIGEFFRKYLSNDYDEKEEKDDDYFNNDSNDFNIKLRGKKDYDDINEIKRKSPKLRRESYSKEQSNYSQETFEEDEDPFNDNTQEKIEYAKNKEKTGRETINEIEYLLKSIRQPDLKSFGNKDNNKDNKKNYYNNNN